MDPELMRAIQEIRESQVRAEERAVRDREFNERMLDVMADLRSAIRSLGELVATRTTASAVDQSALIRWLALAVFLASMGSKALELLPALVGKG